MFVSPFWRKLFSQFLDPELADEHGLVAIGGDLKPKNLLKAYRSGVFPWFGEGDPVLWWSPDPRAIFELDGLHISRRLARTLRSDRFTLTIDRDFTGVIRGCADREEGTWLTGDMIAAYETLHRLGYAHSVEVWHNTRRADAAPLAASGRGAGGEGALAGGIYGVALGGFFAGESMFHRASDASKVALAHLMDHLRRRGFQLFDIQMRTEHTAIWGAIEIPRVEYLERLRRALACPATFV
jgi:leucyl/phenylalanyl-tRNA--protein transferase